MSQTNMTNKTFKEEVEKKMYKEFADAFEGEDVPNMMKIIHVGNKKDVFKYLDLYKQKILEALPKGEEHMPDDSTEDYHYINGRNFCLSEVKQIIENI